MAVPSGFSDLAETVDLGIRIGGVVLHRLRCVRGAEEIAVALTEAIRLKLQDLGFDALFTEHEELWTGRAEQARQLMAQQMGQARTPTVDDIKKILMPLVELIPELTQFLEGHKLRGKHWIEDFTDYVLDRVYAPTLTIPEGETDGSGN